ncbi:MAG: hypothetical protein JW795_14215 [Chitinivibrionales bacterium]|nr:hypothetical protein [Chitinivibrionales bacterium]
MEKCIIAGLLCFCCFTVLSAQTPDSAPLLLPQPTANHHRISSTRLHRAAVKTPVTPVIPVFTTRIKTLQTTPLLWIKPQQRSCQPQRKEKQKVTLTISWICQSAAALPCFST